MTGHRSRWVRGFSAAVLVVAVLPLSSGTASADSSGRGADEEGERCLEQDNGHGNDCPATKEAGPPSPTAIAPVASPASTGPADAPAAGAPDHGKPAVNGQSAKNKNAPAPAAAQPTTVSDKKPDSPKQGRHTPVNACHATGSDSHPNVFITVDDDSVKAEGHLAHRNEPNKTWKSDGVFRCAVVKAGDPKRDLIGDDTDSAGVRHVYDGVTNSEADDGTLTPSTPPPSFVKATGSFSTVCTQSAPPANVTLRSEKACPALTPPVGDRSLEVRKVGSAAVVHFGDPLTYTLTVRALGTLGQTGVVVRDGIPAGTTYASGSAACDASGPCMESFANNEVTWELGAMAPGATRTVTFRATIDTPRATAESGIPAVTIRNTGLAFSAEVPPTPSNQVIADVVAVGGIKNGPDGVGSSGSPAADHADDADDDVTVAPAAIGRLARTGGELPWGHVLMVGVLLLLAGAALLRAGDRQIDARTPHPGTHLPGFGPRSARNVCQRLLRVNDMTSNVGRR